MIHNLKACCCVEFLCYFMYVSMYLLIETTDDLDNTERLAISLGVLAAVTVLVCGIVIAVAIFKAIHDMKSGKLMISWEVRTSLRNFTNSDAWLSQLHNSL